MQRMQIYLSEDQKRILSAHSQQEHKSVSDLIRNAIDLVYLRRPSESDLKNALQSFGIWKHRKDIGRGESYIEKMRGEWRVPA